MLGRGKSLVLIVSIGQLSGSRNTGIVSSAKEDEKEGAEIEGKGFCDNLHFLDCRSHNRQS